MAEQGEVSQIGSEPLELRVMWSNGKPIVPEDILNLLEKCLHAYVVVSFCFRLPFVMYEVLSFAPAVVLQWNRANVQVHGSVGRHFVDSARELSKLFQACFAPCFTSVCFQSR